jgi:hypothetical protein
MCLPLFTFGIDSVGMAVKAVGASIHCRCWNPLMLVLVCAGIGVGWRSHLLV